MARRFLLIRKCELEEIGEDELPGDVLTVLLRNEDQIELDEQELVREMAFFVVAGAQTSIHSLVHVMHEIFSWSADHPDKRQKLLSDPMLLQRCVHESARLHPSSPVARRRAECPLTLATNEAVASGELVTIDQFAGLHNWSPLTFLVQTGIKKYSDPTRPSSTHIGRLKKAAHPTVFHLVSACTHA